MIKTLSFLAFLISVSLFSQSNKIDTLLLEKMIVANVEAGTYAGSKINADCSLFNQRLYRSPHTEAPKMAYITDYVLCNNGSVNMFFEVYDGANFVYVPDNKVTFNKDVDSDNIKVLLSRRTPDEKSLLKTNIGQLVAFGRDYFVEEKEKEMSAERREALQPFIDTEKYGLGFIKYNATEGYSSTGANFEIFNPSKKTIKYIWFTVAGENAVEDLVRLPNGTYYKTLKGIGPIGSYETGAWSFDYVWFTDIVQYLRLSTIKIQYMDGSVRTVKYNDAMYIGEEAYDNFNRLYDEHEKYQKQKAKDNLTFDPAQPQTDVDQQPEFPGGVNSFRMKLSDSFDTSAMKGGEGRVQTEISFIIERDGSLTNIKATGQNADFNREAERTVKSIKIKWIPAKINGETVRSPYKIPLTMNFD